MKNILALVATLACLAACGKQSPALSALDCKTKVLAPYVGDAAQDVAVQTEAGRVDPAMILQRLGTLPEDILIAAEAYRACSEKPTVSADAGIVSQ